MNRVCGASRVQDVARVRDQIEIEVEGRTLDHVAHHMHQRGR